MLSTLTLPQRLAVMVIQTIPTEPRMNTARHYKVITRSRSDTGQRRWTQSAPHRALKQHRHSVQLRPPQLLLSLALLRLPSLLRLSQLLGLLPPRWCCWVHF